MATYYEAIDALNNLLSEKGDLEGVAAAKINELTAELEAASLEDFNPDERIRTGFNYFKTEKFEAKFVGVITKVITLKVLSVC
ncbi:unnamed protein product [Lupinus luteus]|uniref:Uncharacterized protein n=1 Tax=Lupinus luteus TaxID=3873 RepID=A0AAV1WV82_LUPLU